MFHSGRQLQTAIATRLATRDAKHAWTKGKKARAPAPIDQAVGESGEQNAGFNAKPWVRKIGATVACHTSFATIPLPYPTPSPQRKITSTLWTEAWTLRQNSAFHAHFPRAQQLPLHQQPDFRSFFSDD
jgi:hypothetical protein